jgi:hypothetical protein
VIKKENLIVLFALNVVEPRAAGLSSISHNTEVIRIPRVNKSGSKGYLLIENAQLSPRPRILGENELAYEATRTGTKKNGAREEVAGPNNEQSDD